MASENGDTFGQYCYAVHLLEKCSGRVTEDHRIVDSLYKLSTENGDATNLYALCTAVFSGSFDHANFPDLLRRSISQQCFVLGSIMPHTCYTSFLMIKKKFMRLLII